MCANSDKMQQLNCTQSFEGAEQGTARTASVKQEPRAAPAQHTPSSMRHSRTETDHIMCQGLVTGPPAVPDTIGTSVRSRRDG